MIKLVSTGASFPNRLEVSWKYVTHKKSSISWFEVNLSPNLTVCYDFGHHEQVRVYMRSIDALGRIRRDSFHAEDPSYNCLTAFSSLAGPTAIAIFRAQQAANRRKASGHYSLEPNSPELAGLLQRWGDLIHRTERLPFGANVYHPH